ncbi:MFS transporter [Leptolyngbya sp. FACHB-261]|nr:MFS transporter [Leptolyngbya sp. FACHB-261]
MGSEKTKGKVVTRKEEKKGLRLMLRALSSRNYRLFFAGQGLSLIGTWITQVATIWLVYRLTNSALLLGIVGFASQIPSFLLTPITGVLADRWNRHHMLIVTQALAMVQSLTLAALALSEIINIWHIIVLGVFQGVINAFDAPARQALVPDLVENKEDLGNAIALNSSVFNGARLVGPAIAGLLVATVGAGVCFLIDGVSYIAVIAALLAMKLRPTKSAAGANQPLRWLKEGFTYAFGFPPIRAILLLLALVSLMGMPYTILVPVFAQDILHGGPNTFGFLMAASGLGALMGGVYLSSRATVVGLGYIIVSSPAILGLGLIAFALSRELWLSLIMMLVIGLGLILQIASSNTVLQTIIEDEKRGRVMSLYTMSFLGMVPFGNLIAGSLAERIGVPTTLILGGVFCILGSLLFSRQLPALRKLVLPIYRRAGIIS